MHHELRPALFRHDAPQQREAGDVAEAERQRPDGLAVADFDTFGATRRTLRQFLTAAADLDALVRDVLLPDPDKS